MADNHNFQDDNMGNFVNPSQGLSPNQAEQSRLRSLVERIERLEEEKKNLAEDIREIYAEAKSQGYEVKIIRKIIALRKKDPDKRREEEEILALYLAALGM